ncbi:MAG: DUF481 domain-containing protein [Phycisphaera sp.]|nr:DUF481 domain-containing protein [Phycisphaera sp.]
MDPLSLLLAAPLLTATPAPPTTAPIDPTALVLGIQDDADADVPVEEKSPWTGSVGLGLTLSRTTTNTLGFNFGASATRTDVMSTWESSFKYIYNEDDDVVQDNFLIAQSEYDRLFSEGGVWNWFAQTSYQYNETESYRQRFKAFGGLGYFLSRTDELTWNLKGGVGASWDERSLLEGWTARSLLGTNWKWAIGEGIGFEGSASIENKLEDFEQYFAVVEMRVNVALKAMENLNLYVSLRDEYNSDPGPGDSWNSLWVTMGFTYGF